MPTLYRVKISSAHFNMVRRYMVDKDMRSAARAAEEMIEMAAAVAKAAAADSEQRTEDEPASRGGAHGYQHEATA